MSIRNHPKRKKYLDYLIDQISEDKNTCLRLKSFYKEDWSYKFVGLMFGGLDSKYYHPNFELLNSRT